MITDAIGSSGHSLERQRSGQQWSHILNCGYTPLGNVPCRAYDGEWIVDCTYDDQVVLQRFEAELRQDAEGSVRL